MSDEDLRTLKTGKRNDGEEEGKEERKGKISFWSIALGEEASWDKDDYDDDND